MAILTSIKGLETEPFPPPPKGKRLVGMKPATYRLRVGDYRVFYREMESDLVILSVINRKDLETEIKKMK
ncbi:MAG: type II toxin-antitoxin system RelE/ParE family toxin [bacterium]|nr:type II toxin-antitoxin system RelE/ParE family toxin [bacterium]